MGRLLPIMGNRRLLPLSLRGMGGVPAAGGFSAEVQQFFDRLITLPTAPRQALYADLIDALVAAGVWSKLDALWVYAAADQATALTNLKSSSFAATLVTSGGTPTFTTDVGYTGGGINICVSSGFNPSTAGGNYARNDALVACWNKSPGDSATQLFRFAGTDNGLILFPFYDNPDPTHSTDYRINDNSDTFGDNLVADASGFWLAQRTGANATALYRNDTSVLTGNVASQALVNDTILFLSGPWQGTAAAVGASLNSSQRTAFYNALQTYLTGVGAI